MVKGKGVAIYEPWFVIIGVFWYTVIKEFVYRIALNTVQY